MAPVIFKSLAGKNQIKVTGSIEITPDNLIEIKTPYDEYLLQEIKSMDTPRWNPTKKVWTIANSPRNKFALDYLRYDRENPYKRYREPIEPRESFKGRPLFAHQKFNIDFLLKRRRCIIAGEPGTCKTVPCIELLEELNKEGILKGKAWFVSVKGALPEVRSQFLLPKDPNGDPKYNGWLNAKGRFNHGYGWASDVIPIFMTYDEMRSRVENWRNGDIAPQIVFFDEISRLKTWKSKRTMAAFMLRYGMEHDWNDDYFIVGATGTPSPKNPADWWSQCEVVCPGYIKEGDLSKFTKRLALVKYEENLAGGTFPKIITWFDNEDKCKKCGKESTHLNHAFAECIYEPCTNEVQKLHLRLQGLVKFDLKKDCLDLPKRLPPRIIRVKPKPETIRLMNMIVETSDRAIMAQILCRELSDGFQYIQTPCGKIVCPTCQGTGTADVYRHKETKEIMHVDGIKKVELSEYDLVIETCYQCTGKKEVDDFKRESKYVKTEKETVLRDLLDEYEEVGRFVIYAGFEASVDRIVAVALELKWNVIRVDGRGWTWFGEGAKTQDQMYAEFKRGDTDRLEKIVFVGNPDAGGIGLNLTASPAVFFYSNSFKGESRQQAEERIDRPGMDMDRGALIIDVFHLPTDEIVYNNLMDKKDLQDITMGALKEAVKRGLVFDER